MPINSFQQIFETLKDGLRVFENVGFGDASVGLTDAQECSLQGRIPHFLADGSVYCAQPKDPVKDSPKIEDPIPTVSSPPKVIYGDRVIYRNNPVPPARRLASSDVLPVDTTKTKTSASKVIQTLKGTIDKSYGRLLHEPISSSPVSIKTYINLSYKEDIQDSQETAANKFLGWITGYLPEDDNHIGNTAVAFFTKKYQSPLVADIRTTAIFGMKGIIDFVDNYTKRNNVEIPIASTVPTVFEVINFFSNEDYAKYAEIPEYVEQFELKAGAGGLGGGDIEKILGLDDFPITVPSSLISQKVKNESTGEFQDQLVSTELITSIPQFIKWFVERFDELMGQWEIQIDVDDIDETQEGNQSKSFRFPNQAELLAEMFTLMLQGYLNTETLINMCTRTMMETGTDKRQNFITYKLLLALVDWAGFKTKEVKAEMSLLFDPSKTNLDEVLKETKTDVSVQEFDDKFGLEIDMMRFRKASAILDSVFFRKINPNADIKEQIMNYLKDSLSTINKIKKDDKDDFDDFLDEAQEGFINTPGITDNINPYNKAYSRRPIIRNLTKFQDPE